MRVARMNFQQDEFATLRYCPYAVWSPDEDQDDDQPLKGVTYVPINAL